MIIPHGADLDDVSDRGGNLQAIIRETFRRYSHRNTFILSRSRVEIFFAACLRDWLVESGMLEVFLVSRFALPPKKGEKEILRTM